MSNASTCEELEGLWLLCLTTGLRVVICNPLDTDGDERDILGVRTLTYFFFFSLKLHPRFRQRGSSVQKKNVTCSLSRNRLTVSSNIYAGHEVRHTGTSGQNGQSNHGVRYAHARTWFGERQRRQWTLRISMAACRPQGQGLVALFNKQLLLTEHECIVSKKEGENCQINVSLKVHFKFYVKKYIK